MSCWVTMLSCGPRRKEKVFNHWQGIGCPRLINVKSKWKLSYQVWVNRKATVAWITDSFKSKWKECIIIWSSLNMGLCNCKPIRVTMLKKRKKRKDVNHQKYFQWACKHQKWILYWWKKVAWSDEAHFSFE